MDSQRVDFPDLVLVDGGDFIHRNGRDNRHESILTWNEMARQDYAGVTLGELEFRQWDLVDSLMQVSKLNVICTNVEQLKGDQWVPIGEPYRIVESNGVKVGILSVISETHLSSFVISQVDEKLRVLPPMRTTRETVALLKEKADVLVLLAHLDPRSMEQYASSLPDVDLVVGGHMTRKDEGPIQLSAEEAIINRSSTRGQHISVTRMIVSPDDDVVDFGGLNVTLNPDMPEDPVIAELAETAKNADAEIVKARNAELRNRNLQRRQERKRAEPKQSGSSSN